MKPAFLLALCLSAALASATTKFSEQQRISIIRTLLDEHPYARCAIPRGQSAVVIQGGAVTPSEAEVQGLIARSGAVVRPGDRVQITSVRFVRGGIQVEVNGGAKRPKKWNERISIGTGGPNDQQAGADVAVQSGFSVLLKVSNATGLTATRIEQLLSPLLDFRPISQAEAYQNTLPPPIAAAVKDHRALIGMDREMLLAALGRPPRRIRESQEGQEYEEWIYGAPPQDVQFIRLVRGRVVRIEQMSITGEKHIRTEDEVGKLLPNQSSTAQPSSQSNTPTLLRPGDHDLRRNPAPMPQPAAQ